MSGINQYIDESVADDCNIKAQLNENTKMHCKYIIFIVRKVCYAERFVIFCILAMNVYLVKRKGVHLKYRLSMNK
jgi:hypothetical protein